MIANPYSQPVPSNEADMVVEDYDSLSLKYSGPSIEDILKKATLSHSERAKAASFQHRARDEDEDELSPLPPSIKAMGEGRPLKPYCTRNLAEVPYPPSRGGTPSSTGEDVPRPGGPRIEALCVSIARNATTLAVGCHNGTVVLLNTRTLEVMDVFDVGRATGNGTTAGGGTMIGLFTAVTAIKFRPVVNDKAMQNVLLLATGERVVHLHTSTGRIMAETHEVGNNVSALAMQPDGAAFASAGSDKVVRVYDEATVKLTHTLEHGDYVATGGHSSRIFSLTWKPDDPHVLLSGGWDKTVQVWDLRVGRSVLSIYGPYICGDALDVHHHKVLTGSWRQSNPLQLWDIRTSRLLTNLHFTHSEPGACLPYCAKFLVGGPEAGGIVAAGSGKHPCVRVYLQDGEVVGTLRSPCAIHGIDSVEPAPATSMLAVGGATQLQMVSFS